MKVRLNAPFKSIVLMKKFLHAVVVRLKSTYEGRAETQYEIVWNEIDLQVERRTVGLMAAGSSHMKVSVTVAIVIMCTPVLADSIRTAFHTLPPGATGSFNVGAGIGTDGMIFDNRRAQTFTPTVAGRVDSISFVATRLEGTDADLRVSLTTIDSGQPATVLFSTLIDVNSFTVGLVPGSGQSFTTTIDLSVAGIILATETQYALVFSTDTTEANYRIYGDNSGYLGGTMMRFQNSGPFVPSPLEADLFFEARVSDNVPILLGSLADNLMRIEFVGTLQVSENLIDWENVDP